ncbi:MAG: hydrolase TatD [Candidatus Komeilibacteria bacterium CG_4_10_14_0_2_um_filter_37_10]|uniref:Hydrolase TatD n=1 Tax=Candidatus Komeilibacteria bacterium CG_4_10_14_0_2_um_filter_37_10 TaxID=1974470 RepID=A0A2M7VFE3_9BACT|nr:MAG: hydrolase TatD [Candidatus Komeilibacteria bacterium CG_4_10_14_0_2_um_filter_37_10]
MLIDSHAHLDFEAYASDRSVVIDRCLALGMKVINVGSELATSKLAVTLAEQYDSFYACIGLHPIHVFDEEFISADYQELIKQHKRIVAIGETGCDYFYLKEKSKTIEEIKIKQKEVFVQHIKLAQSNNLPLMLHGRNGQDQPQAYQDIINTLREYDCHVGLIHCFGGNQDEAQQFLEQGFHLGFTGIVTFTKKAEQLQYLAKTIPLDKMIIETDSPYLTPEPYRGERNEPIRVAEVARKVASLRGMGYDELVEQVAHNSFKLFKL